MKWSKFFIIFILMIAWPTQAAELFLQSNIDALPIGYNMEVGLFINTEAKNINALEGELILPSHLLAVDKIKINNSIINFWVEKPELKNNKIKFSGIIPGGYNGTDGQVLALVLRSISEGQGLIVMDDIVVLLNDGQGTEIDTNLINLPITVSQSVDAPEMILTEEDNDPPETFQPLIDKIPAIGSDNYLLIFTTQDKGSGIDRYEVKEGWRSWKIATSPYILKNQKLNSKIFIKAIDEAGNERVITITTPEYGLSYKNISFFAIIILVILILYIAQNKNINVFKNKSKNKKK